MSRSLNKATLIGNVGQDPEVRTTQNGGRVATFSLATSRTWNGPNGDRQEKTEWHRVVVWNAGKGQGEGLANIVEKYVKKGDKLYVEGPIDHRPTHPPKALNPTDPFASHACVARWAVAGSNCSSIALDNGARCLAIHGEPMLQRCARPGVARLRHDIEIRRRCWSCASRGSATGKGRCHA
ncbi:MAG: single-stranded DNA-binding protein [Gemmatimonadaceae bacterium]